MPDNSVLLARLGERIDEFNRPHLIHGNTVVCENKRIIFLFTENSGKIWRYHRKTELTEHALNRFHANTFTHEVAHYMGVYGHIDTGPLSVEETAILQAGLHKITGNAEPWFKVLVPESIAEIYEGKWIGASTIPKPKPPAVWLVHPGAEWPWEQLNNLYDNAKSYPLTIAPSLQPY